MLIDLGFDISTWLPGVTGLGKQCREQCWKPLLDRTLISCCAVLLAVVRILRGDARPAPGGVCLSSYDRPADT